MKMLWGQVKIEMKLFLRDRQTVFWTYFFPVFLIIIFGLVFSNPRVLKFSAVVVDEDQSPQSIQFVEELKKISVLKLEDQPREEAENQLKQDKKNIAIILPAGFGNNLYSQHAQIELLYNPAQPQVLQIVSSILQDKVTQENWNILNRDPPIEIKQMPVQAIVRNTGYIDFLVPGLIGFSLMSTCLFTIGVVVVSYREKGKLRRLAVTPLPKAIFIGGQIVNRYIIVLVQALLLIGIAYFVFNVQMVGNIFALLFALTIGMLAFISLGYSIASVAKTTESASGIANVLFFPMMFLSGVYFSVEGLPKFLQPLIEFLPLTHLVRAVRSIFNNGAQLVEVLPQMGILSIWMIACFAFSVKKFRWE